MASCLFSLSITSDVPKEQQAHGFEAARLYRELGDRGEAARAALAALITVHEPAELVALEPEIQLALEDSQADASPFNEGRCYKYLAQLAAAKGDAEASTRYARWASDLDDCDGLTPTERWEENIAFCRMLLAKFKESGNKEAIASFQEELRRLKAEKPTS